MGKRDPKILRVRARQILLLVTVAGLALTCRLDRLLVPPVGALLCVAPAAPDTLRDSAASGSASPRGDTLAIRNCGGGDLRWRASLRNASSWLTLRPDSGVAGDGRAPEVLFDPAALVSGSYHETIIVRSANGSGVVEVPVTFFIYPCRITPIRLDDSSAGRLSAADCGAPHRSGRFGRIYDFPGTQNDSASLELASDYDAYVTLDTTLDGARPALAQSGACLGTPGVPCLYYQRLPSSGEYYVEVTSVAAADSGEYTLHLVHPRLPNEPQGLDQLLTDSVTTVSPGATVQQSRILLRAALSDRDLTDSLRLEAEVRPLSEAFSGPNIPDGLPVANGTVAWVSVGGLSDNTAYHWRVRALDNTGRSGSWVSFGGSPDFAVNVLHPPNFPSALAQARADGTGLITGGTTDTGVVIVGAVVSDSDAGDSLRLQVEVRPVGTSFSAPTDSSAAVLDGGALQVIVGPLPRSTSYHWRARSLDQTGSASAWVSYGGNAETAADFTVSSPHDPAPPSALAQLQNGSLTPIPVGGVPQSDTVVLTGTVTDPDPGQTLQFDVEVEPVGQMFLNQPNYSSGSVASGATALVSVGPLADHVGYHWQARTRDNTGIASAWVSFPISPPNAETDVDFGFPTQPPVDLVFTVQPRNSKVGARLTPPIVVTALDVNGQTATGFTGIVTMTLAPNFSGATLTGTTTMNAVAGVATFSSLIITGPALGLRLRATTTQPPLTVLSNAFNVKR